MFNIALKTSHLQDVYGVSDDEEGRGFGGVGQEVPHGAVRGRQ